VSDQIWLLLGLLVLVYVGSLLVGDRTIRGFGLPSAAEYLLLGFVLGPHVLGRFISVLSRGVVETAAPLLLLACAWVALVAGIGYGQVGQRRIRVGRALVGVLFAALVAGAVACAVWYALHFAPKLTPIERLLLAGGAGAASSETTRHAVRWVVERHGAQGDLSDTLADYARASVLVPAALLAVLFAAAPGQGLAALVLPARAGVTIGVGVVLGLVATLLLGREFRRDESWGILLGTSFLGMGIANRLGQSAVATTFFMGLTVAMVSPHRADVKTMVTPTEKPVVLPMAVLAGASVHPDAAPYAPLLIGAGLLARLAVELVRGALLSLSLPAARPAGSLVGLGMVSIGAFSLASALALQLRLPGELGASILAYTAVALLLGELFGPLMLRRALTRAGEIAPTPADGPASVASGEPRAPEAQ
jgi:hypothetical protein